MLDIVSLEPLLRTPLYDIHSQNAAKFVPFAGYEMPIQYQAGVMQEHRHTRTAAGLFDVSHMGQIALRPLNGESLESVALALEALVPMDIVGLPVGRQRYAVFTNDRGGILDDLMVSNFGDHLVLVVNAARKQADIAHLQTHLADRCKIEILADRALIALQGPLAESVLVNLIPAVSDMRFMDVRTFDFQGSEGMISRSGYTGSDGFEISIVEDHAAVLVNLLLENPAVAPIGLGARDCLRLEAGMCLYGADIDETTTPIEAGLDWAIQESRRSGGVREGGFPGANIILLQLNLGAPRLRVGLLPEQRVPFRDGTPLFVDEHSTISIGMVTSGGFGPSLDRPIAMGYLPRNFATPGRELFGEVRGKRLPVRVATLPFITTTYKRT